MARRIDLPPANNPVEASPNPAQAVPPASEPESDASEARSFGDLVQGALDIRSFPLMALLVLAVLYTLYFARPFLLPIILAGLFTLLLRPLVVALKRVRIPEPLGAAIVVMGLLTLVLGGAYSLSGPASSWLAEAPDVASRIEAKVMPLIRPVKQVTQATAVVEEKLNVTEEGDAPEEVQIKQPGLGDTLMTQASAFIAMATVVVILLYFLLASGDFFLRKLVKVLPNFREKKRALEIAYEVQQGVSRYLFTVSMVYFFLGVATAIVMWLMGMPNPILWGVLAGLLNFIPYIGAMATAVIIGAVAILTFDSVGYALLVPLAFLTLTTIEGYIITPTVLGRALTLNPVMVFLAMTFWWWLWGIPGALLAVPLLAVFKIMCDHIEPLQPISEFLGD
jgi:predicted PurR-regulated permease PerM